MPTTPLHLEVRDRYHVGDVGLMRRFANGRVPAAQMRHYWDYRAEGLTAPAARQQVADLLRPYGTPNHARGWPSETTCISPRLVEYKRRSAERRRRLDGIASIQVVLTPQEADGVIGDWSLGECRLRTINGGWLVLRREETVTWTRYSHQRWPDKVVTYSAYAVSPLGDLVAHAEFTRRGKWLKRLCVNMHMALACGVGLPAEEPVESVDDGLCALA